MSFVDSNEYERLFWVHQDGEQPTHGESFEDEEDAIEAAKDAVKYDDGPNYVVTEILERVVGTARMEIYFERE